MANTITLKRRIGSVKNTKQITKAMELVAASKMRRTQDSARKSREYRQAAYSLLSRLSTVTDVNDHPLFNQRPVKTRMYVVLSSNRGLAGAYNANIAKLLARSIIEGTKEGVKSQVIAIGKQGAQFTRRLEGVELYASYPMFGDNPTPNDIRPILNTVIELFREKKVDDVVLLYTDLKSNILQVATELPLLPARAVAQTGGPARPVEDADLADGPVQEPLENTTFEPSVSAVLDNATVRLLEVQLWQATLESVASEHSMRMLAMKNATDNATELIDDLTLEFNTARQAAITQELAEITGGAEAIK